MATLGLSAAHAQEISDCSQWNPCCFEYGLNPPPVCPTCCGCTWYGDLEYLYWKPFVNNAQAADIFIADNIPINVPMTANSHFTTLSQDFKYDWDSGFRVGLGYGFPCDKWGLSLTWTHYRTDAYYEANGFGSYTAFSGKELAENVNIPIPGFLGSNYTGVLIGADTGIVTSKWDFQLNQLDLDFFRDFYVGCSLSIKPYVGLRALILKQGINSISQYTFPGNENYEGYITSASISQILRSDFKSFGLKAGLESYWEVVCGLGVYGNLGTSILYTHYKTDHQLQWRIVSDDLSFNTRVSSELPYDFNTLKMTGDLSIGIEWRKPINCNQNLIIVKGGWEHHIILNGSELRRSERDNLILEDTVIPAATRGVSTNGNISLYGFAFSVALAF